MSSLQNLAVVALAFSLLVAMGSGRMLMPLELNHAADLKARLPVELAGSGGLEECRKLLLELRSCTNEIVLFFQNWESYLSLDCCRAIRITSHGSDIGFTFSNLGFTTQESNILRGYCDAETAHTPPAPPLTLRRHLLAPWPPSLGHRSLPML